MDIQTIITNLERTVKGKQDLLKVMENFESADLATDTANRVTIDFLKMNIDELQLILLDCDKVRRSQHFTMAEA